MNDITTKHGDTWFMGMFESSYAQLANLTIRSRRKIPVTGRRPFWDDEVTVQVIEDGIVMHCNHAGAKTEKLDFTVPYWNGENMEMSGSDIKDVLVCDKCHEWSDDGEEWYE